MTVRLQFRLAAPLLLLNQWQRMHWRDRSNYTKWMAWEIAAELAGQRPVEPMPFCDVGVWRHSIREPDQDGLIVKALLDALQPPSRTHPYGLGIILQDSPHHCRCSIQHVKAPSLRDQCTQVVIREIERAEIART